MTRIYLSLVIPVYNEEKILVKTLNTIYKFLSSRKYKWEILIVDDGSHDKTQVEFDRFIRSLSSDKKKFSYIKLPRNQGKGSAVKKGMLAAFGDIVLFFDADLSTPLAEIDTMINHFKNGYEVVIGSRKMQGANIRRHQPFFRETLGKGYTFLTKFLTGVDISDFTCGFKGFTRVSAKKIFKKSVVKRWAFDAEVMHLAKKHGYAIYQMPVTWKDRRASRVRLFKDVPRSLLETIGVTIRSMRGRYG